MLREQLNELETLLVRVGLSLLPDEQEVTAQVAPGEV